MARIEHRPRLLLLAASRAGWAAATGEGLRVRGWSVVWAGTADAAAAAARRILPDVVMVAADVRDGERLVERLRAVAATALVPAVMLADDVDGWVPTFSGAQAVLASDATVDELDAAVRAVIESTFDVAVAPAAALASPARLAMLAASGLLDDDRDTVLHAVATLTAGLLQVPSARVSLLTVDRQRLVARSDPAGDQPCERPLTHSLCQWVVAANEPLVVGDARVDPLLAANGAVTELGDVAYLGTPLCVDGQVLGTLCVVDGEARDWTPEQLDVLDRLAAAAMAQLRVRLAEGAGNLGAVRAAATDGVVALAGLLEQDHAALGGAHLGPFASILGHFAGRLRAPTPSWRTAAPPPRGG